MATTLLPPTVNGYSKFDLYPTAGNKGDVAKAKAALAACGKPNGFTTNLTARSDRPAEMDDGDRDPGFAEEDRHHRQHQVVPVWQVLHQLRGRPELRPQERRSA